MGEVGVVGAVGAMGAVGAVGALGAVGAAWRGVCRGVEGLENGRDTAEGGYSCGRSPKVTHCSIVLPEHAYSAPSSLSPDSSCSDSDSPPFRLARAS